MAGRDRTTLRIGQRVRYAGRAAQVIAFVTSYSLGDFIGDPPVIIEMVRLYLYPTRDRRAEIVTAFVRAVPS